MFSANANATATFLLPRFVKHQKISSCPGERLARAPSPRRQYGQDGCLVIASAAARGGQPWFAAFKDDLSHNVVQIDLEEGPRLTTTIGGVANNALRVRLAVRVPFRDVSDSITLPRFRLDQ